MSTVNLLPEDYVKRGLQKRANMMCLILFGVTMVAVIGAAVFSEQSSRKTRHVRDQVEGSYAQAAQLLQQMQDMDVKKQDMLVKAKSVSQLLERVPRSYLLGMVANALPESASLTRFDLDLKRVVQAPPTKDTKTKFETAKAAQAAAAEQAAKAAKTTVTIDLVGLAATDVDVARFIANLARNQLTGSVDLVYSQEKLIDKTPFREFQVHIELKSNADALLSVGAPEGLAKVGESKSTAQDTGVEQ